MNKPSKSSGEFEEFLNASAVPPEELTESIFGIVHRDLNPSPQKVFVKVSLIHIVMGSLSILGCAQFGLAPFGFMGISAWLKQFGDMVCAMGCGAFFVFGTVLVLVFALRPEELKVLRRTAFAQMGAVLLLSLCAFYILANSITFGWTAFWTLGSLGFGVLGIETLFRLRSRAMRHS